MIKINWQWVILGFLMSVGLAAFIVLMPPWVAGFVAGHVCAKYVLDTLSFKKRAFTDVP